AAQDRELLPPEPPEREERRTGHPAVPDEAAFPDREDLEELALEVLEVLEHVEEPAAEDADREQVEAEVERVLLLHHPLRLLHPPLRLKAPRHDLASDEEADDHHHAEHPDGEGVVRSAPGERDLEEDGEHGRVGSPRGWGRETLPAAGATCMPLSPAAPATG